MLVCVGLSSANVSSNTRDALNALSAKIPNCFGPDQWRLIKRLKRARQKDKTKVLGENELATIQQEVEQSIATVETRQSRQYQYNYDDALPVVSKRNDIIQAIKQHQVVVVCGETGSGKTTQLPKLCLEAGRGVHGYIGHTQPRRIAARSVAARIAEELSSPLGELVGYKVRFQDRTHGDSAIKLMTDGILLAETINDRDLMQYDTLIIDEAHERSLNIDFLLGFLKHILPKRSDLKVIITSATIDPERFSTHFDHAPIISVSGRTYPVELRYRPLITHDDQDDLDLIDGVIHAVDELGHESSGDILVFLSGEREIREVAHALEKRKMPSTEVLPLYARLSQQEQQRIFSPHGKRRIVLATNVAETSLTVPGIRYVIDSGHARISRYSYRSKVQRLPIESISRASADQRKGRCGRVAPGICIRLYAEEDFNARPEFTEPEIQRTNLASVILQMMNLRLGRVDQFPFIDAPDHRFINDGYKLLQELGAVDEKRQMTELGKRMSRLPIEPRIARMILATGTYGGLREVLIIASALSVQDPRERPAEKQQAADGCHSAYRDKKSDFIAYLNLWHTYHDKKHELSNSKLRDWCKQHFISHLRMREWIDIHQQLTQMANELMLKTSSEDADYEGIHRALLTGLLSQLAFKKETYEYQGARNTKVWIFPGSGLSKSAPKWIMAAQWLETSKMFAHTVAQIEPEWVEEAAQHLIKRHYSEPHWQQKTAKVGAFESITLFGLPVVVRRRVNYGPIDSVVSRELFIRHALVYGEWQCREPFYQANLQLIAQIEALEAKGRRRDILVDEHQLYDFFDARIPPDVYDGATFQRWWRQAKSSTPELLALTEKDVTQQDAHALAEYAYPDAIENNGIQFNVGYAFEPGKLRDGITVNVPLAGLNLVDSERFEWLVPGLIEEKIIALIKGLPKSLRRHFVPAPDYAKAALERMDYGEGNLFEALSDALKALSGVAVPLDEWNTAMLPEHLRVKYALLDDQGKAAKVSADIKKLGEEFGEQAEQAFANAPKQYRQQDLDILWQTQELPERVSFERHGMTLQGYPALQVNEKACSVTLIDHPEQARNAHKEALIQYTIVRLNEQMRYLRRHLPNQQTLCLHYASLGTCQDLVTQILHAGVGALFFADTLPRSETQLTEIIEGRRAQLVESMEAFADQVGEILALYYQLRQGLKHNVPMALMTNYADIGAQLAALVEGRFVVETPYERLQHVPRYLSALWERLQKMDADPNRDRQRMLELQPLQQRLSQVARTKQHLSSVQEYRWMLEEFRVSVFAQHLGTLYPVSAKRLDAYWTEHVKPQLAVN